MTVPRRETKATLLHFHNEILLVSRRTKLAFCNPCLKEIRFEPFLRLISRYILSINQLKLSIPQTQANWFRAAQYCRFHGMHLASISSQEENDRLEKHIRDFGKDL